MRKDKIKATKPALPYKRSISASEVVENVEKAAATFLSNSSGDASKYKMILVAADRGRDLARGAPPRVGGHHRPLVTALLEIEAGLVGRDYVSETVAKRS
jgi:DNA-directed RNA polymerase omega subunit